MKRSKTWISIGLICALMFGVMPCAFAADVTFSFTNYGNAMGEMSGDQNDLTIVTNGGDIWNEADDASAYLAGPYPFLYDEASQLTIEAEFGGITGTNGNPSGVGVTMRAENTDDAANVLLRAVKSNDASAPTIQLTYREKKGEDSSYKAYSVSGMTHLRLTRKGNVFTAEAKANNAWTVLGSITVDLGTEVYAGIAAYSRDSNNFVETKMRNIVIEQSDTYDPSEFSDYTDTEVLGDDVLLRENFEDGSLLEGTESARNPIWEGASKYISTYAEENGNHWLTRDNVVGSIYSGGKYWTDYEMSVDVIIDAASTSTDDAFMLIGRRRNTLFYQNNYYRIGLTGGNKLVLQRVGFWGAQIEEAKEFASVEIGNYADGVAHNLKVRFWDNVISVWYDNELKIEYKDAAIPLTWGSVGIDTGMVSVKLDNIYVRKYQDVLGGDYDNYLRSGFDMETDKLYLLLTDDDKDILKNRWGLDIQ